MESPVHVLVIDPQNDFVTGSLAVPGAPGDMDRLVGWIDRNADRIDAITVSLDQHHLLDISHPEWWRDADGNPPPPFTPVSAADLVRGRWRCANLAHRDRTFAYLRALESSGRYPHVVWPEHCLIGDPGSNLWPAMSAVIHRWERAKHLGATRILKGTNPFTEHFSAIRAEVPDPDDLSTQLQRGVVAALAAADRVVVAGEARSHCVANTVRDLVAAEPSIAQRLWLLTDATSDVPTFEALGHLFVEEFTAKGMHLATTDTFA